MKKFALVSAALPPSQSGQSTVLFHLLKNLDPRRYCLITQKNIHLYSIKPRCSEKLPAHYYFFHPDYQIVRGFIRLASLVRSKTLLDCALKIRVRQIKKILRMEQCDVIIACTGDLFDPPAAFIASKELGIPLILYSFDYYSFQGDDPVLRSFAQAYEQDLLRAAQVIVPNECMRKEYRDHYGIDTTIIHNPFDIEEYEKLAREADEKNSSGTQEKTIVYTGAIYDAHYDAFRNLVAAIPLSGNPVRLHLYTPQSPYHLVENNITGPVVEIHKAQPAAAIPAIQQSADILFLPLSFNPQLQEMIRTSAPGKMGEYLASGRPILVHAPKDSFVSRYFTKYNCGLVVDENSPEQLARAIDRLLRDTDLCREITHNAYERAKNDFDINAARKKLFTLIDGIWK